MSIPLKPQSIISGRPPSTYHSRTPYTTHCIKPQRPKRSCLASFRLGGIIERLRSFAPQSRMDLHDRQRLIIVVETFLDSKTDLSHTSYSGWPILGLGDTCIVWDSVLINLVTGLFSVILPNLRLLQPQVKHRLPTRTCLWSG